MKPINLCALQVRIGKCHLNLKSDGLFGVSLQMGKHISQMSPKKRILNNIVPFNTTLRINIDKQLLDQQANAKCRILLHLIRQNKEKQVIGVATIDVLAQNNKGFKYHEFGQCADCEADIQVSITCSSSFQLGVKSQIGYFYTSQSRIHQMNDMNQSRGKDFDDSIIDDGQSNILKQSKAVSNIQWTSLNRPRKPSINFKPRRSINFKDIRKPKPENLSSCPPQQIITHYETEIKTLQQEMRSRDEWANGMKKMIQELQAENQLLKQIRIEELYQNNIQNLQQGIEYVSKIVHSKFEASRSMIYDTQNSYDDSAFQSTSRQKLDEELKLVLKQTINERKEQSERSIAETKSFKELPQITISPRMGFSPLKGSKYGMGQIVESRQDLQNALKILTGEKKDEIITQDSIRITQLEQTLFKVRQEKQQLSDITEELYQQLKQTKHERDSFYEDVKQLGMQLQKVSQYVEQLRDENQRLKEENQQHKTSFATQQYLVLEKQKINLQELNQELERKLKESLKAIEEFKNDALNARSQLIMKEHEINSYKLKFGDLGSMTEVFMDKLKTKNHLQTSGQKRLDQKDQSLYKKINSESTTSTADLHSIYSQLLESSIMERKQLQHSVSQVFTQASVTPRFKDSQLGSRNLKKVQLQINRLFIEIFKNTSLKNMKQIETIKREISTQIDSILCAI